MTLRHSNLATSAPLFVFAVIPLILTPGISIDAVNIGKFFFFSLASTLVLIQFLRSNTNHIFSKSVKLLALLLFIGLLFPLFFSEAPLEQQIFGTWGRNIGALTYLASLGAFIFGFKFAKKLSEKTLISSFLVCSLVSMTYGTLQFFGYDFVQWSAPNVFGTLGNINFYSAHLAIVLSLAVGYASGKNMTKWQKFAVSVILVWNVFLLTKTNSLQGILIALISILLFVHISLARIRSIFKWIVPCALIFCSFLLVFDFVYKGPITKFLFTELFTFKIRIYFYQAAIKMFMSNPLWGVGIDSYEDSYRLARPDAAYFGGDLNEPTDSAHNLILDYAATGGIFLLLFGLFIYFLTLKSIKNSLKNAIHQKIRVSSISLSSSFGALAFLLQSLVSPQQIGLLSWGFLLCGLTCGFQSSDALEITSQFSKSANNGITELKPFKSRILTTSYFLILIVSIFFSSCPLLKEYRVLSAQKSENISRFSREIQSFPRNAYLFRNGIMILESAGYIGAAASLGLVATKAFPKNYALLVTTSNLRGLDSSYINSIKNQLEVLNPRR